MKFRLDFFDLPDYLDLIEEDEASNLALWLKLVRICVKADDEGRLTHRLGKPWSLRQIARSLRVQKQDCVEFLQRCRSLDLIAITQASTDDLGAALENANATIRIVDWQEWYGVHPLTGAQRVAKHRQNKRAVALKSGADPEPKIACNEGSVTPCNVSELHEGAKCNALSKSKANRKQIERKSKQTRKGESERENGLCAQSPMLGADFSENEFLLACETAHQHLTGKQFPKSSHKNTLRIAQDLPQSEFGWKDKAGAVLLAAQKVAHEVDQGKTISNLWGFLLPTISDHLTVAEQYNRLAKIHNEEPEFLWSPEPVRAAQ